MRENNKILLAVLAFVVTAMIGYALFSDNIKITGSATAQGTFDIKATCIKGVDNGLYTAYGLDREEFKEGGYKNDYCNVNGNSVSFGANLEFPSAVRYFTIILTNNGTIPAKINPVTGVKDDIKVCQEGVCLSLKDNLTEEQYEFLRPYYFGVSFMGAKNSSGNYITDEEELNSHYNETTKDITINTGESVVFVANSLWHELNPPYSESKNTGDYQTIGKVDFEFIQVTE